MSHAEQSPNAYTVKTFCAAYSIGHTLLYKEIASGRLKAKKVGHRTLILKSDAEAWVNALPPPKAAPEKVK